MLQAAQAISDYHAAQQTAIRLGKVIESSSNQVYICDGHSFKLQQSNGRARTNLGYQDDEISQLNLCQLLPEFSEVQLKNIVSDLYSTAGITPLMCAIESNYKKAVSQLRQELNRNNEQRISA